MSAALHGVVSHAARFSAIPRQDKATHGLHTPNEHDAALVKGANLVRRGALEQGLAELDRAIEHDPTRWEAHFTRGEALGKLGRGDAQIEAYQAAEAALAALRGAAGHVASSTDGTLRYVRNALGDALTAQARHDEACTAYELVMRDAEGAGLPPALSRLGACMHAVAGGLQEVHDEGERKLKECRGDASCEVAPADVGAVAKRGKRLFRTRLAAVEALAEAVALSPGRADFVKALADYLLAADRHAESAVQFRKHAALEDAALEAAVGTPPLKM